MGALQRAMQFSMQCIRGRGTRPHAPCVMAGNSGPSRLPVPAVQRCSLTHGGDCTSLRAFNYHLDSRNVPCRSATRLQWLRPALRDGQTELSSTYISHSDAAGPESIRIHQCCPNPSRPTRPTALRHVDTNHQQIQVDDGHDAPCLEDIYAPRHPECCEIARWYAAQV
jgi:hypothetical protein